MRALKLFTAAALFLGGLALAQLRSADKRLALGDPCRLTDGRLGTCVKIEECPAAIEELQNGKQPTTCFFEKWTAISCCPKDERQSATPTQPPPNRGPSSDRQPSSTNWPTTTASGELPTGGYLEPTQDWSLTPEEEKSLKELADQKCDEYRYAYQQQQMATLAISDASILDSTEITCPGHIEARILGGTVAAPQEFPHVAVIGFGDKKDNKWGCGGSLISRRHILTAASCVQSKDGLARWVLLGAVLLNDPNYNSEPQEFEIVRLIRHPRYKPPQRYNDIAILELNRDVNFTGYVRPACLYTQFEPPKDDKGIATGFGRQDWLNTVGSNELLKVKLPFLPYHHCNETYRNSFRLPNGLDEYGMLCAGDLRGNKDTCQGDGGGPLQVRDLEKCIYRIVGITSFGSSVCGAANSPAVYTRVSSYVPWIAKTIWT